MGGNVIAMMGAVGPDTDPLILIKDVYFRPATPSDVVKVGQPVCYNADIVGDYKERTVNPIVANAASNNASKATTYAEGAQTYDGRIFIVERPSASNIDNFAGAVLALGDLAGADGDKIKIAIPNGAMISMLTDVACILGETHLSIVSGEDNFTANTGDYSRHVSIAQETVDRSGTDGLVWGRLAEVAVADKTRQVHIHAEASTTLTPKDSGSVLVNKGAGATAAFVLPTVISAGTTFTFVNVEVQAITVDPGTGNKILLGNGTAAGADGEVLSITNADANDVGSSVTLVQDGDGDWIAAAAWATAPSVFSFA
jgi:hypothetical protein